jgi:hypothetical protein
VKRQLTIVFFDAGGGPRGAAEALKSVLENHQRPWEVQLLTLQQKLDKLDLLRMLTGIRMRIWCCLSFPISIAQSPRVCAAAHPARHLMLITGLADYPALLD